MKKHLSPALLLFLFFAIAFGGLRTAIAIGLAAVVLYIVGLAFKEMLGVDIYSKRGG